nr:hypothetical protein Itr_chr11CG15910 [Ipomoea trifida]
MGASNCSHIIHGRRHREEEPKVAGSLAADRSVLVANRRPPRLAFDLLDKKKRERDEPAASPPPLLLPRIHRRCCLASAAHRHRVGRQSILLAIPQRPLLHSSHHPLPTALEEAPSLPLLCSPGRNRGRREELMLQAAIVGSSSCAGVRRCTRKVTGSRSLLLSTREEASRCSVHRKRVHHACRCLLLESSLNFTAIAALGLLMTNGEGEGRRDY